MSSIHSHPDLQSMFKVQPVDKSFRRAVPRRIESIRPFIGVTNPDVEYMKHKAYELAGLTEYNECWTGEMAKRPIPFVSTDEKPKYAQQLFEKYFPAVLRFLLPQLTPHVQPINKVSSLGYPISGNPGTGLDEFGVKVHESKFDVVLDLFQPMQAGDFSAYKDAYHTIGVRKQNEPPGKKREFQFITADGVIYQETISAAERMINVPDLGERIGSRTRTIVRPPVVNLWLQNWDSMIHNAIMKHPLCESNVYAKQEWPSDANFVTFDCKHFERYLGLAAISYANAIGGSYGEQLLNLIYAPFIVPSDNWKRFYEITPQYRAGVYPQFSSGLSPVAPLGKLCNICAQVGYFTEVHGLDINSAVQTVFSGVHGSLRRWMYGDDNRLMGDQAEIDQFIKYMSDVFEIEIDDTPKYLGTVFRRDTQQFMLPSSTYHLKLYQPERDYEWKDYPHLGLVERRAVFQKHGEPEISTKYIPYEDELWNDINQPFYTFVAQAVVERKKAAQKGVQLSHLQVTDKEYLMTEQERLSSGLYWHLKPEVTASIVLSLVSAEVRQHLTFRDAKMVSIPTTKKTNNGYVLPTSIQENYAETEA